MRSRQPRTVLLDALGTLLTLEDPVVPLRANLSERFELRYTVGQVERALAAEIAFYRRHLAEGRDEASLAALRRRCAGTLRDALPPSAALDGVSAGELTSALLDSLSFAAYPDAVPALAALHAAQVRLVVVSNWDVSLHDVLTRAGLAPLLDGVLASAEVGAAKPDPEIFHRALELTGTEAAGTLHVGDSVDEDVEGARRSGVQPILLRRHGTAHPGGGVGPEPPVGVPVITSLTELGALVAEP